MAEKSRKNDKKTINMFLYRTLMPECYASQCLFGRSANRGECAQVCRMSYDLVDADGRVVVKDRYLLSCRSGRQSQCRLDSAV